jgi:2-keto-3-deoxy-L-rhamnonate aldolase RhmA
MAVRAARFQLDAGSPTRAAQELYVIVQPETSVPLDVIEAVLELNGIDGAFVDLGDFSAEMSYLRRPRIDDRDRVFATVGLPATRRQHQVGRGVKARFGTATIAHFLFQRY